MAFFKMYGWSEEEINFALRKSPGVFRFSEEIVQSKMYFLIKKAGFEPRIVAAQPVLLMYSLESRLIPWHNVPSAMQANGLKMKCSFPSMCCLSEKVFHKRFVIVVPYEKDAPEICEAYIAACAGKVSI